MYPPSLCGGSSNGNSSLRSAVKVAILEVGCARKKGAQTVADMNTILIAAARRRSRFAEMGAFLPGLKAQGFLRPDWVAATDKYPP
jgi:hypothetical protein